jgi:hypothetical protein
MDGRTGMTKIIVVFAILRKRIKQLNKGVLGKQLIKYCDCRKNWIIWITVCSYQLWNQWLKTSLHKYVYLLIRQHHTHSV